MQFLKGYLSVRRFHSLPHQIREIVFYSEGKFIWPHLKPIVTHLAQVLGRTLCYLSSDPEDPGLTCDVEKIFGFYVGDGVARTTLFRTLQAKVLVTSTPDLQDFQLRRSVYPVFYVYVHHSVVSSHMAYRRAAFDHFDEIFCVGPHHIAETRESESIYNLRRKQLFEHGYGRLDSIIAHRKKTARRPPSRNGHRVLLAPSWGPNGIIETIGEELVGVLLQQPNLNVIVRPHPQTLRRSADRVQSLVRRFHSHPRFRHDNDVSSEVSLHAADVMITDWSGAAVDFAFGLERPVLFVDLPRKIRNSDYGALGIEPVEAQLRDDLGAVLDVADIKTVGTKVTELACSAGAAIDRVRAARERAVFNVGSSGEQGAARIIELVHSLSSQSEDPGLE